ncbi:Rap1a/Tai family immunity protein [Litoricola sp.]|nr:Rap1a/Tai family immunity protein [Litorivicinus sp.]
MKWLKHAFEWGYGYGVLALCGALAYTPFVPVAYAGNYMTATMIVNMAESKDMSRRAMAAGYVAAIHDELAGRSINDPTCFAVPQSVDMQQMADRVIHFVDRFTHDLKGWPKDKDFMYPARELVQLGLIKHFPCEQM